ncbi:DsrE family protein [Tibeticola sp.]|uniref:DsrE family protein n=1 Tax=Tibeticola sp. TaxID=2005368 RepID=UPI0025E9814F|nr:DsrE family protein [Tibeticola sp.]
MRLRHFFSALLLAAATSLSWAGDKVVYHFDNSDTQATAGLRTLRNYMDTAPDTKIVVVALGDGVKFLMDGAKDPKNPNIEYGPLISDLVAKGVKFEVCELTMRAMNLKKDQFVMDAGFTPSGVVRIGQLQFREQYGYIKP